MKRDYYIDIIDYYQDILRIIRDKHADYTAITEYDSVYSDILEYQDNDFENWKEKDFVDFIVYLRDLIVLGLNIESGGE